MGAQFFAFSPAMLCSKSSSKPFIVGHVLLSHVLLSLILVQPVFAALPPPYQNANDLGVPLTRSKYIKAAAGITSVDMQKYVVHFGTDSSVQFEREVARDPTPAPAGALTFKSGNCPVD